MIDVKELRIGNWICSDTSFFGETKKREWQVSLDDLQSISDFPQDYDPIPITEEWLLKFGYECFNGRSLYSKGDDDLHIDFEYGSAQFRDSTSDGYNHVGIAITYVHQLQNLYFALTGKELEIKENQ